MESLATEFAIAYRRISQPVKYRSDATPTKEHDADTIDDKQGGWKTVGGSPAYVGPDGQILAGCPGLEDENIDDITDESDASRDRRERKMEAAEDAGWESQEVQDAREAWQQARDEMDDDTLVMLKIGDTYHAFGDDANAVFEITGAGDGQAVDIKEGGIDQHLSQLVDAGHRISIAERDEDGNADIERVEGDDAGNDSFGFPWESDDGHGDDEAGGAGEAIAGNESEARQPTDAARAADSGDPELQPVTRADRNNPARVQLKGKDFDVYRDEASGFWFFQKAGRRDLGWTLATKHTRDWLDGQLADGVMMPAPGRTSAKPEPKVEPKPQKPDKPARKLSRFDEAIQNAIGDDPEDIKGFKSLVLDVWKRKADEVESLNHSYRNLLGHFVKQENQGAFIRTVQKLQDPDGIKHFDEMVEVAARDYPELLDYEQGNHAASGDAEYALFNRLKQGLVAPPAKWSDEVIGEAFDFVDAAERSAVSRKHDDTDWSQVEFSRRKSQFWKAVRYSLAQSR